MGSQGGFMPTISGSGNFWGPANVNGSGMAAFSNVAAAQLGGGNYASISNYLTFDYDLYKTNRLVTATGRGLGIRA